MNMSPEFQRNLWLELTPHRMVGMPAILLALFLLMYLTGDGLGNKAAILALVLYLLFTVIWGGKLVSESVVTEMKERTWDAQRMSSISPWSMTWGKLFGSAIFAWYGALICLALYGYILLPEKGLLIWKELVLLLGAGAFAQSVGMLLSLVSVRRNIMRMRSISAAYLVFGIMAATPFIQMGILNRGVVQWYGTQYVAQDFVLASLLLFLAWALLGNYRLMRSELQLRGQPWLWMGFVLFVVVYLVGLVHEVGELSEQITTIRMFAGYAIVLLLVYIMLLSENKSPVVYRRMLLYALQGRWRRMFEEVPCWMATVVIALAMMVALNTRDYSLFNYFAKDIDLRLFSVTGFLFMLRDVAIVFYFNLARSRKRSDATALLYLALLYFLVPAILGAIGVGGLQALLLPWSYHAPVVTIMSGVAQLLLMGWLIIRRWQRYFDFEHGHERQGL